MRMAALTKMHYYTCKWYKCRQTISVATRSGATSTQPREEGTFAWRAGAQSSCRGALLQIHHAVFLLQKGTFLETHRCVMWCVFSWNVGLCTIADPEAVSLLFVTFLLCDLWSRIVSISTLGIHLINVFWCKKQTTKNPEHNLCNYWLVPACVMRFHENTANLSWMNKLGNDFNPSRYVPDGFSLLPETVSAGTNAYEQQEECSASERRQVARIQQVRDGWALSEHKYGTSGAGLLFVFTDFFSKKERISLLLKLSKSYEDHSRIQSKNWEGKSVSFPDYSTWKVSVMAAA